MTKHPGGLFASVCVSAIASLGVVNAARADTPITRAPVCNIVAFGAVSSDNRHDTPALQAAINACAGKSGIVIVPEGSWSTGMLRLGSQMTLRLDRGAILALHPDIALFPITAFKGVGKGSGRGRVAFLAEGVTGLRIEGAGRIEGNGPAFWDENLLDRQLKRPTLPRPEPTFEIADCRDTHISGITLTNLPAWGIRFNRCDGVKVEGVTMLNDPRSPNTDGLQFTDTSNAVGRRLDIRTGDDAIVLKSETRVVNNILIEDSKLQSDDGAIKFGTSSAVGVTNSVFRNIDITQTRYGIAIFTLDGGTHRNNLFENIRIATGGRHKRAFPIFADIDRRNASDQFGGIDGLVFRDIKINTDGASLIGGNPSAPMRNVTLDNIQVAINNPVDVRTDGSKPRGNKDIKDQAGTVDYSRTPANFVFVHVDGLVLKNIDITSTPEATSRSGVALVGVSLRGEADVSFVDGASRAGRAIVRE